MTQKQPGFTLIEIMLVVAIIAILAIVVVPKYHEFSGKAQEGATKGKLGELRTALTVYYSDNFFYPTGPAGENAAFLRECLYPRYLDVWPTCLCPDWHPQKSSCEALDSPADFDVNCNGEWNYIGNDASPYKGTIFVGCAHHDSWGTTWSSY